MYLSVSQPKQGACGAPKHPCACDALKQGRVCGDLKKLIDWPEGDIGSGDDAGSIAHCSGSGSLSSTATQLSMHTATQTALNLVMMLAALQTAVSAAQPTLNLCDYAASLAASHAVG
eukprot:1160385-Pelagomonas_calceolata.AAC.4